MALNLMSNVQQPQASLYPIGQCSCRIYPSLQAVRELRVTGDGDPWECILSPTLSPTALLSSFDSYRVTYPYLEPTTQAKSRRLQSFFTFPFLHKLTTIATLHLPTSPGPF